MKEWHVYIFETSVWDEVVTTGQYSLPSHKSARQSDDGVYTQIVGELPECIAAQAYKPFGNERRWSKQLLDEWKESVSFNPTEEGI